LSCRKGKKGGVGKKVPVRKGGGKGEKKGGWTFENKELFSFFHLTNIAKTGRPKRKAKKRKIPGRAREKRLPESVLPEG